MPSLLHEMLVELFRQHGELAPALLRRATHVAIPHARTELSASELTQIVPVEYRADAVIKLYANDGSVTAAVIIEVQLRPDDDKRFTWPLYVAALRERLRCPVHLLVIAKDHKVARWASQPIALDARGFSLRPIAIAFPELQELLADDAVPMPDLALLSTLDADDPRVRKAASAVTKQLRRQRPKLYSQGPRPPAPLRRMEAQMLDLASIDMERIKSDLFELHIETTAWQGRLEALRTAVRALASAKLGAIDDEQQARIAKLFNEHELHQLITALGVATTAGEARTVLDRAIFLPSHPRYPR